MHDNACLSYFVIPFAQASNVEMSILNRRLLSTERQLAASHKHATVLERRLQEATAELDQLTEKYG